MRRLVSQHPFAPAETTALLMVVMSLVIAFSASRCQGAKLQSGDTIELHTSLVSRDRHLLHCRGQLPAPHSCTSRKGRAVPVVSKRGVPFLVSGLYEQSKVTERLRSPGGRRFQVTCNVSVVKRVRGCGLSFQGKKPHAFREQEDIWLVEAKSCRVDG